MIGSGPLRRARVALAVAVAALAALSACDSGPPPSIDNAAVTGSSAPDPWGQLAGRVAAAKDRRFSASYTYIPAGGAPRTVSVVLGVDGSWLVAVPGGGLGGTTDIVVAGDKSGLYQCRLGAARGCVRLAAADGDLPAAYDPMVEHPFTDWLDTLRDRSVPLSVAVVPTLKGVSGTCFSVEATSASIAPPVDPGVYCFTADGLLTGAQTARGTLVLAGAPAGPPASVPLPAPAVGGPAVPIAAPPTPSASPLATKGPTPTARPTRTPAPTPSRTR